MSAAVPSLRNYCLSYPPLFLVPRFSFQDIYRSFSTTILVSLISSIASILLSQPILRLPKRCSNGRDLSSTSFRRKRPLVRDRENRAWKRRKEVEAKQESKAGKGKKRRELVLGREKRRRELIFGSLKEAGA